MEGRGKEVVWMGPGLVPSGFLVDRVWEGVDMVE